MLHINDMEDEFHYVIKCPFLLSRECYYLGKRISTHPSIFTFNNVMHVCGTKLLKLSQLTQIIIKSVVIVLYAILHGNVLLL